MGKTKQSYLPLRVIQQMEEDSSTPNGYTYEYMKPRMEQISGYMPENRLDFIKEAAFMGTKACDLYGNQKYLVPLLEYFFRAMKDNNSLDLTDAKDAFVYSFIVEGWSYTKQVFQPDADFSDALFKTNHFSLSKYDIEHLKTNTFFIDFAESDAFHPIYGAFVHVVPFEDSVGIIVYLLSNDLVVFSHYMYLTYDENMQLAKAIQSLIAEDDSHFFAGNETNAHQLETHRFNVTDQGVIDEELASIEIKYTRKEMSLFILQLLGYMTSEEPDIEESKLSKSAHKPIKGKPKNKFSEIQSFDVGVRYGTTIRAFLKQKAAESEESDTEENKGKGRKSPIPHFRSAHWQVFWTGEGRKIPIKKWIQPTFVGFKKQNQTDVVIHRMKQ